MIKSILSFPLSGIRLWTFVKGIWKNTFKWLKSHSQQVILATISGMNCALCPTASQLAWEIYMTRVLCWEVISVQEQFWWNSEERSHKLCYRNVPTVSTKRQITPSPGIVPCDKKKRLLCLVYCAFRRPTCCHRLQIYFQSLRIGREYYISQAHQVSKK